MLLEQRRRHPVYQAHGIEHKFKTDFTGINLRLFQQTGLAACRIQISLGLFLFNPAANLLWRSTTDLTVGTGTDADIVTELPVVDIVSAVATRSGISRGFILLVTGLGKPVLVGQLPVEYGIFCRQSGRLGVEQSVGLDRKLI